MAQKRIPKYGQYGPQDEIVDETEPQFGDGPQDASDPDPMSALSALLTDGAQYTPPPAVRDGSRRNNALSEGIARKYGVDPGASQVDLEALDNFIRSGAVHDKVAEEVAPIHAKGTYDLQAEGMKGQNALDVENMKGTYGLKDQALKNQGAVQVAGMKGGAGAPSSDLLDYLAEQSGRDASTLTKIPMALRSAVLGRMSENGTDINAMSNQTRQMSETANDLLPMIDSIITQAQDLHGKGQFDLINSPMRQFFVKHGAGTLLGYGDDAAANTGKFQTALGLLQSGIARAHAGARGAGNTAMAERFEKLANAGGDLPTFLGELQGVRELLTQYAAHTAPTHPNAGADPWSTPPTAAEQGAR